MSVLTAEIRRTKTVMNACQVSIMRLYNSTMISLYFYIFLATQASFLKNVKALVETMENIANPFFDTSGDLLVLDTLGR